MWEEQGIWLDIWRKFLSTLDREKHLDWSEAFADGSIASVKNGGWRWYTRPAPAGAGETKRGKGTNRRFMMGFLEYLTIALLAIWSASEVVISLISHRNRSRGPSEGGDRFSFFVVWLSIVPPIWFAALIQRHLIFPNGFGSFSTLSPLLGYLGCLFIVFGISIRLVAVATLRKQFTITVSIVEKHEIVETGIYRTIRHPAYLGILATLLGFGLALGNWFGLAALVVLPLAGVLYRIRVEETALLRHFGLAYQKYASRTKRLLPGIY